MYVFICCLTAHPTAMAISGPSQREGREDTGELGLYVPTLYKQFFLILYRALDKAPIHAQPAFLKWSRQSTELGRWDGALKKCPWNIRILNRDLNPRHSVQRVTIRPPICPLQFILSCNQNVAIHNKKMFLNNKLVSIWSSRRWARKCNNGI